MHSSFLRHHYQQPPPSSFIITALRSPIMKRHADPSTVLSFSCLLILLLPILTVGFADRLQAYDPPLSLLKTALQQEQKPEGIKSLRVREGAPFKIALFADLHFGENAWTDWGPQQDVNSIKVMSSWASVFGNHDDAPFEWPMEWFSSPGIPPVHCPAPNASSCSGERDCSFRGTQRIELMKKEIEHNHLTLSKNGPKDLWPSISNYVLQLSSSDDPESPVLFMYFLDSGGGSYPEVISNAQAEWFQHVSEEINPDSRVHEVVFWHIPSKAYKKVAPRSRIHKPCVGSMNKEEVAAQEAELGIMDMLVKRSSVKAVFAGHNHGLDWCCPYKKLWLCYARHTGYGGYGNWPRGARILEINDHPFYIKSWIKMEDGDEHSQIILSP